MNDDRLKAYLFVVDSSSMSLKNALAVIDTMPKIENWQGILPDAAVLVSKLSLSEVQELLHNALGRQRYIITALEKGKKSGWLAKNSWDFINNPSSVFE